MMYSYYNVWEKFGILKLWKAQGIFCHFLLWQSDFLTFFHIAWKKFWHFYWILTFWIFLSIFWQFFILPKMIFLTFLPTPWSFQLQSSSSGIYSDSSLWKDISLTVMESIWQNLCHWMRSMMKINFFDVKSISFEYSTNWRIKYSIYGINEVFSRNIESFSFQKFNFNDEKSFV